MDGLEEEKTEINTLLCTSNLFDVPMCWQIIKTKHGLNIQSRSGQEGPYTTTLQIIKGRLH